MISAACGRDENTNCTNPSHEGNNAPGELSFLLPKHGRLEACNFLSQGAGSSLSSSDSQPAGHLVICIAISPTAGVPLQGATLLMSRCLARHTLLPELVLCVAQKMASAIVLRAGKWIPSTPQFLETYCRKMQSYHFVCSCRNGSTQGMAGGVL